MNRRAVFLDRDGTLIQDGPFLSDPNGIKFLDGVPAGLRRLKQNGFLLILITNQSGIGRGYFTEEVLQAIHARLESRLEGEGASLDAIYYCPHSPENGCGCRKPSPELFLRAIRDFGIDPAQSYVVGDKPEDADAAKRAGCTSVLIGNREGTPADYGAPDFDRAVGWILEDSQRKNETKT